jgi:site-specific recombinase XerD
MSSRRDGLSPETLKFYRGYLNLSKSVICTGVMGQQVKQFIDSRQCNSGGKHAYYRTLRAFYNWLYSPKSGYGLNPQNNPMLMLESPKVGKRILPSLTADQICLLIDRSESLRDKAIISLFTDSGLRSSELTSVKLDNIDWKNRLIKVKCKGNKEGLAPFGGKTEALLKEWLAQYSPNGGNVWGMNKWDIFDMLRRLRAKTKLPCNPHTFRRSFASILAKSGIDLLHIMRLGRWESISMVERYTRSIRF